MTSFRTLLFALATLTVMGVGSSEAQVSGCPIGSTSILGCYRVDGTTITVNGGVISAVGGGGAVSSVANSDGTLTISPTTGSVVASLALGHANTWTGIQTLTNPALVSAPTAGDALCYIASAIADCGAAPATIGTGLSLSGSTLNNNATDHVSYQPGLLTAVNATKAVFHKFSKASTVDNLEGSAATFSCVSNPTITMFECGTSTTCASSPVTIGTVTITAAGTVVDGTVSNPAITAGDYVAFATTGGTCASSDLAAVAQVHAN